MPFGNAEDCRLPIEAADAGLPRDGRRKRLVNEPDYLKRASDVMRERNATLAHTTVLESGKPLLQAKAEWALRRDPLRAVCGRREARVRPLGTSSQYDQTPIGDQATHGCSRINYRVKLSAYNIALAGVAALAPGCTVVILLDEGPTDGEVNLISGELRHGHVDGRAR